MPDVAENTQVADTNVQTDVNAAPEISEAQQEINRNMAYAFDEKPSAVVDTQNQDANTDVSTNNDTQVDTNVNATPAPVFEFKTFTDEFGYEKPEDAIAEIKELRNLKANPPVQEQKYENEESKKLHQLFLSGKIDEAVEIINTQKRIETLTNTDVTESNADDIIKLNMQLKYKDAGLTQKEIDYKFNKQYGLPKEPTLDVDDDESVTAHNEWKERCEDIITGKIIDAKAAKIDLQSQKQKLVLPEIQANNNVDQDYEDWKASNAKAIEASETILQPAINSLKETDLPFNFKVEDSGNQMDFDVAITPTKEDFESAQKNALDVFGYIVKNCNNEKGEFVPQKLVRMFLLDQKFDNYAQSIARQAVNAERARVIAKETGSNSTSGKDFNTTNEKSELQKRMEYSLS